LLYSHELRMCCDSNPDCADVPQYIVCSLRCERGEQRVGENTQRTSRKETGKTAVGCSKI
jgi:hypothetical protein